MQVYTFNTLDVSTQVHWTQVSWTQRVQEQWILLTNTGQVHWRYYVLNANTLKTVASPNDQNKMLSRAHYIQRAVHRTHSTYNQHILSEYMNGKFARHKQHEIIFLSWLQKIMELHIRILTWYLESLKGILLNTCWAFLDHETNYYLE